MTITHLVTASELENMGSDARFELFQGTLHEMSPSSFDSSEIGMRLGILLGSYVFEHDLGILSGENGGYRLERDPDSVVAPDVGFVTKARKHLRPRGRGSFPGPPDLAIEVISPTDEAADIRRKQALYERTGTPLVWWIDPKHRTATVHAPGQPPRHLTDAEYLDGESVVPGFTMKLADLFDGPR